MLWTLRVIGWPTIGSLCLVIWDSERNLFMTYSYNDTHSRSIRLICLQPKKCDVQRRIVLNIAWKLEFCQMSTLLHTIVIIDIGYPDYDYILTFPTERKIMLHACHSRNYSNNHFVFLRRYVSSPKRHVIMLPTGNFHENFFSEQT